MTSNRERSRSGARWGWLFTTLALGLALGVTSWANYRSVRDAVATIDLGQGGVFENVVRNALRGVAPGGGLPELDSLVAVHSDAGLRFVGMFSPEVGLTPLGGTAVSTPMAPPRAGPNSRFERVGDRIRAYFPSPPRPGERPPPQQEQGPPPQGAGPPNTRDGAQPPDRAMVVIEFEPLVAGQLMTQAVRSLMLGGVAAVLLMLTAVLFWRATLRQEADERTMEEQRRLSTLGELSAILAHEIRNPLASLKGHAQLLAERTPDDAPERGRVARIVIEAQRLQDLTTDLLDFVRTGPLDRKPVSVDDFLRGVVATVGIGSVRVDTTRAPDRWDMDAPRMHQVLSNLLDNAVDASPEGAPLEVTASKEGRLLVITVRDQGEGITDEKLAQIFEPFFTTRTKGTGLGLAVARRIVEMHGGTLTASSSVDSGSEFRVTLPEPESSK